MRAPQVEQHGRRHRKTNQEVLDEVISLRQELKNATMYVEVCEVMDDIMYAMVTSCGGTYECPQCMYENKRDMLELKLWERENSETIERWLQLKGCHLFRSASIGGCGHVTMPWQVEARKNRIVW